MRRGHLLPLISPGLFLSTFAALVSCTSLSEPPGGYEPPDSIGDGPSATWQWVRAREGGTLTAADGAVLRIPPGALAEDTYIAIVPSSYEALTGETFYLLEPAGLQFDSPVTLTFPYAERFDGGEVAIQVLMRSDLNPVADHGSELSYFVRLEPSEHAPEERTMSVELEHFSELIVFVDRLENSAYLVLDIPGRYLLPGDVLVALTHDPTARYDLRNWAPGHVGAMSMRYPMSASRHEVIEANDPAVARSTLRAFKADYGHLYLGARRPRSFETEPVTHEARMQMVDFLESKLGEDYFFLGAVFQAGGWSCVELVEEALDEIGHGVITFFEFYNLPKRMYEQTDPVDEIVVEIGDEVDIPVYGAVAALPGLHGAIEDPNFALTAGIYTRRFGGYLTEPEAGDRWGPVYTVEAYNRPSNPFNEATFEPDSRGVHHFRWSPSWIDAVWNQTTNVTFEMEARPRIASPAPPFPLVEPVTKTASLSIEVQALAARFEVKSLTAPLHAGQTIKVYEPFDREAIIGESKLIDLATGEEVADPIFEKHHLSIVREGWSETPGLEDYYGVTLALARDDVGQTLPDQGTKELAFVVMYRWPHQIRPTE